MLERNCSVGKGGGAARDLNEFASVVDERVERNGGKEPFLIGVAGGTASGKTTVCDLIMHNLQEKRVVLIAQDSFYRGLTQEEHDNVSNYNFDHPDAIDVAALIETLKISRFETRWRCPSHDFCHALEKGGRVRHRGARGRHHRGGHLSARHAGGTGTVPHENIRRHRRRPETRRPIEEDTVDRGRSRAVASSPSTPRSWKMFDTFVSPSKRHADVIIPWAQGENNVAIDLIVQHIRTKLGQNDLRRIYPNLIVLPPNFQIRGMHTIIRSARCNRSDFVFYSDRLIRLVVEHALGHLPFKNESVRTPNGDAYDGVCFSKKICGVSIIRSGEAMENALRACCKGIKIGKVLIERRDHDGLPKALGRTASALGGSVNGGTPGPSRSSTPSLVSRVALENGADSPGTLTREDSGEASAMPRVIYEKMPSDIKDRYVLLLDPILATGVSSMAAIDRLIKQGVRQDRIMFVTVIAASQGIHALAIDIRR